MIEVKDLTKYYGDKLAVDHVSFSVQAGEIVGFLGPNGAGKSTTMNMLTGYLAASSGTITIDGIDLFENPREAKRRIGYLPEIPPLYMDMTVDEYLKFMFRLKKVPSSVDRKKHLDDICDQVNLTRVQKRLIRNLSKGYRQRVGIAQAMVGDPRILILDEPTVGLDPNQIVEIRRLIQKLGQKHTVILSSHILQEIQAVCGRILIMNEGKIVADDTKGNLTRKAAGGKKSQKGGRMTAKEEIYQVLVEGPKDQVAAALAQIPAVKEVETDFRYEASVYRYRLQTDGENPVRRAVFDCVAGHGWRLLGLESRTMNLEDIFTRLTAGGYAGEDKEKETEAVR